MELKDIWSLLKTTFSEWSEDKAARLAAALAYYTIFSLAPLLVIAVAIAGLVFQREAAQGQIVTQLEAQVGRQGAEVIQGLIQHAGQSQQTGILATIIGLVTLVVGALGVFGQLQDALNTIWEVAPRPGRGLMGAVMDRLFSFTMVLGIGFLLLVSLIISAALTALGEYFAGIVPGYDTLLQIVNFIISFGVITLLFAMIYKILPDVEIGWRDVWIGALITALLFTVGKYLIGLYLGRSTIGSAYGAAGSFVVLLVWIYYSAQILLFGAEFTQVYANKYGAHIRPSHNAVALTDGMRVQQGMARPTQVEAATQPQPAALAAVRPERPQPNLPESRPYRLAVLGVILGGLLMTAVRGIKPPTTSSD